eukprot:m.272375 g.272375  ORF g.272375 m.272375 type:complete len:90 (-) comp17678_c0_seq5:8234-8503(-)
MCYSAITPGELTIRTAKLGSDHPTTAETLYHLGQCYGAMDRLSEAKEILAQAIEIQQAKLGEQHPDTIIKTKSTGLECSVGCSCAACCL